MPILSLRGLIWLAALGVLAATAPGCATVKESSAPSPLVRADSRYELIYPTYIELCAVSQIRANFTKHGGSPGHAAMYLKGACRDPDVPYPSLELCDPSVDPTDRESGSGVSVNKILKNVNWIATPGKRLFFYGNLDTDDLLDKDHGIATIHAAEDAGVFDGVKVHGSYLPPDDDEQALLFLAAAETLGTDFALSFGRSVFCSRLPMPQRELGDVIDYLNSLNREYAEGDQDYHWSGYNDNCSHTIRNALAAADVWKPKSVRSFRMRQVFNLSVPANEFADLALMTTNFPIDDFDAIYRSKVHRRALVERGWLPGGHGSVITYVPVHQNNELYDPVTRIFILTNPLHRGKAERVDALYDIRRNTDVEANLRYYREIYARVIEERPSAAQIERLSPEKAAARVAYDRYIDAQLADVDIKLEQIERVVPLP